MPTREEDARDALLYAFTAATQPYSEAELMGAMPTRPQTGILELIQRLERHVELLPDAEPIQWVVSRRRKTAHCHHGGPAIRIENGHKNTHRHRVWVWEIKNAGLPRIKPASQVTPKFNPV